jgi:hypothetical protein
VQSRTSKIHGHGPSTRILIVRFILILSFYLRCDIKMDKNEIIRRCLHSRDVWNLKTICVLMWRIVQCQDCRLHCVRSKPPETPRPSVGPTQPSSNKYRECCSPHIVPLLRIKGWYIHCPCTSSWREQPQPCRHCAMLDTHRPDPTQGALLPV